MKLFPDSWTVKSLNEVCSEIVDCINKTAPTVDGPTPYKMIRTTNVRDGRIDTENVKYVDEKTFKQWNRRATPKREDVILTREAPLGEVGLLRSDDHVFLGQRTMLYRADPEKLDQRFLYYSMRGGALQSQIRSLGSGATVEHLRVPDAEKLEIPFPEKGEQRKIAAVLSAYDDLIENNNRRIALLEKMAEEIYREWFVRLRFPGHESTPIRKGIPEGWQVGELQDISVEGSVSTGPGEHLSPRDYVPIDLLQKRRMLPESSLPYTEAKSSLVLFEERDILFGAMRPYQHKVCIAPFSGVTRSTCLVIRPLSASYFSYLYWTLFQPTSIEYATLICNGADRPYVVWRRGLERMPLFVPPENLASRFNEVCQPIFDEIMLLFEAQKNLAQTRDLLLSRLISGKLSVENLDIQLPPSMREDAA